MASVLLSSVSGSGIKSVQRGSQAFLSTDGTVNIAVTSVDMDKSFITFNVNRPEDGSSGHPGVPGCRLTTSTNIAVSGNVATTVTVYWELVEFL
jgi:hypothetical protein